MLLLEKRQSINVMLSDFLLPTANVNAVELKAK